PATSSFVSLNGPSMTVVLPREWRTRTAFEVGCRPARSSRTPAFDSSSLNFAIASRIFSSGITPASDFSFPFTNSMNFMTHLLVGVGGPCRPLITRRTAAGVIDTGNSDTGWERTGDEEKGKRWAQAQLELDTRSSSPDTATNASTTAGSKCV